MNVGLLRILTNEKVENKRYIRAFDMDTLELALRRLSRLNLIMIILSVYLFYNDYVMLTKISNTNYRSVLFIIHISIFIISFIYLVVINILKRIKYKCTSFKWFLINFYIFISILIGIAVSLNSIKINLNIYTYVTIVMFLAVFIPCKSILTIMITCFMHIAFLISLSIFEDNSSLVLINQINSTVTVVVTMVVYITFYNYRKNEFINGLKLLEKEENLIKLFEINPFPLFIIKMKDAKVISMNKKAMEYYNFKVDDMEQINPIEYFVNIQDKDYIIKKVKEDGFIKDFIMEQRNGDRRSWTMVNCELVEYQAEQCMLIGIIDITKVKLLENDLAKKASIDALTGTINRMKGMELLRELYEQNKVNQGEFAIVFCDINSLKSINDDYGHNEGDRVIYSVVNVIAETIDQDDIVFRYGGDEFLIILQNRNYKEKVKEIQSALERYQIFAKKPYDISASFGIEIVKPDLKISLEDFISEADKKMYMNKAEYYRCKNR